MKTGSKRGALFLSSAILALSLSWQLAAAQTAAQTYDFNIPAESLGQALSDFSVASSQQLIFSEDVVTGRKSAPVHGRYTASDALSILLAGSDLRMATASNGVLMVQPKNAEAASNDGAANPIGVETVVVTGTHIAGAAPAGSSVADYSRADIEKSGSGSLDQFARQMPANVASVDPISNGFSNATFGVLGGTNSNSNFGSSFNLNGVGPEATLTLLNGHRLAPAGSDGSLVDISVIPLSAIDRVEVITDGASAIYGADAVAGVANIIMRKDFDGQESSIRYGGATDGGAEELTVSQLVGRSWESGNILGSYEYNQQDGLDASQRDYFPDQGGPQSLIPKSHRSSVFLTGRQEVSDLVITADFLYTARDFANQFTNAGTDEHDNTLTTGSTRNTNANITIEKPLGSDWTASVSGSYSQLDQDSRGSTLSDIDGDLSQFISTQPVVTRSEQIEALINGTLFELPGGAVRIAVGGEYRREAYSAHSTSTSIFDGDSSTFTGTPSSVRREVESAYVEVLVPLVQASNSVPLIQSLELSAAGRYDHYSDFGDATNPKVGLKWGVNSDFDLRGTYGTSFRAPLLAQIGQPVGYLTLNIPDPSAVGGFTDTLEIYGGNRALEPETSTSFTFGTDLHPTWLSGLVASVNYFNIDYSNRISTPQIPDFGAVFTSPLTAPFITRNPPLSVVEAAFPPNPNFSFDTVGLGPEGVMAILDNRFANLAKTHTSGLNFKLGYTMDLDTGGLSFLATADRYLTDNLQSVPDVRPTQLVDTFGGPVRWKARGSVTWSTGPFTFSGTLNYVDSYQNSLFTPEQPIVSWTTFDAYIGYSAGKLPWLSILNGARLSLSVQNLFDARPPVAVIPVSDLLPGAPGLPYDPVNASPVGRLIAVQLTVDW